MASLTITWVILIPVKGICTKLDQFRFLKGGGMGWTRKPDCMMEWFSDKDQADRYVNTLKLGKKYNVLMITDAQFGKINASIARAESMMAVATSLQKENMFQI